LPVTEDQQDLDRLYSMVAGYFSLFSEPMRLRIMHALCDAEKSVNTVVAETGGTQTNVSRHLALMHREGVLARRKQGTEVYYRVADEDAVALCRSICTRLASRMEQARPPKKLVRKFMAA
jgi:DNA-binding transcriptional ArsR family regulator